VTEQRRTAWFAVPGAAAGTAWVDATGNLPTLTFSVSSGSTTVRAVHGVALPEIGLRGPVLECRLHTTDDWTPETVVPVFVELGRQPEGWIPPPGWSSAALDGFDLAVDPGLAARAEQWRAEQLGRGAPDPLAPAWSRPGWYGDIVGWAMAALAAHQPVVPVTVEPVRLWGIAAMLRLADAGGRVWWCKATCDLFHREAAVTAFLAQAVPGLVAPVVAVEPARGWVLLGDLGEAAATGDATSHTTAYPALRELQRALTGREADALAAGAVHRPLAALPDAFADALADPLLSDWHDVAPERAGQLVAWLHRAVGEVAELGLPDVVVHGDFHPGNVATLAGGERVVFDWSDAALGPPFLDVPTWLSWLSDDDDEPERARVWESFATGWADVLPADAWRARRTLFEGVAGAYHVVSYAGILRTTEPSRHDEHGSGIGEFLGFVTAAVPG